MGKPVTWGSGRGRLNRALHRAPFYVRSKRMSDVQPANRQWVAVTFGGGKAYTYHNDGEPLAVGDVAIVETKTGSRVVEVVGLVDKAPPFPTRPARKTPPKTATDGETAEGAASDV